MFWGYQAIVGRFPLDLIAPGQSYYLWNPSTACTSQGSPAATASQGKEYLLVFLSHSW